MTRRTVRRCLHSAFLAASVLAADVVLLTLFLNPEVSPFAEAPALLVSLFLPYCLAGGVAFSLLALLASGLRFWPQEARSPIERLPWFTALSLLAVTLAAALFFSNLFAYRYSIPAESVRSMAGASVSLVLSALVLLAVGIDVLLYPLRGRGLSAPLSVLAPAAAVTVPLALLAPPSVSQLPRPPLATESIAPVRRVTVVGIDGLGPAYLREQVEAGSLPVFARMIRDGAFGPLATIRPTEGPPLWTTVFTGRLPRDHGVKSFSTYRLWGSTTSFGLLPKRALVGWLERAGLVSRQPVTAAARRCPAVWNALGAFGIEVGLVRIWATFPTEPLPGFVVSNYFHLLRDDPRRLRLALHPPDLIQEATARAVSPRDVDEHLVAEFLDFSAGEPRDSVPWRQELVERALAQDLTYERVGAMLRATYDPPFFATYFYGLDVVGHTFLRFARPDLFGDVSSEEARRYGRVLDRYVAYLSRKVGELLDGRRDDEIVIVISTYGMEPVPFWMRLFQGIGGGPPISGTHADAPDGVLLAVGNGIRAGAVPRQASILDVAPTLLYLMGLPVARDMEGRVLTEILDEGFAHAHPVTFIPGYQNLAVSTIPPSPDLSALPPEEEP